MSCKLCLVDERVCGGLVVLAINWRECGDVVVKAIKHL